GSSLANGGRMSVIQDSGMTRHLLRFALALATAPLGSVLAQQPSVVLPPASSSVTVRKDVVFGRRDIVTLHIDVYRPGPPGSTAPTLIFWNRATGADRSNSSYASWAQAAASRGVVAI